MIDYREILRLDSLGYSRRRISSLVNSSHHTVEDTLKAAHDTRIAWPLEDDVTNAELQGLLFPWKYVSDSVYAMPDFAYIHRELAKNGVTLTLLWEEYCTKVRSNDSVPYSYTQFGEKYRRWARVTKATMRITHKPGDAMQVDWAGDPLYITDSVTGEQWPAYIFVAVLPCSWYTYAEACGDMKQENWLLCHVHAFDYFGGVPRLLIPDNAKTATITNNRYEVVLNRSSQELAEHYGTAIVPARVRRPDDKTAAEGSVKYVSTWITAALRDRKFFSLDEARRAVIEKLEELNRRPFKKRAGCRFSAFEEEEREFMRLSPPRPIKSGMRCGVYMAFFLLKAPSKAGHWEAVCDFILDDREHSWLNMLREGATTLYEAWGKTQKWNTSLCHPWACAPLPILIEDLCGITPALLRGAVWTPHLPVQIGDVRLTVPLCGNSVMYVREREVEHLFLNGKKWLQASK